MGMPLEINFSLFLKVIFQNPKIRPIQICLWDPRARIFTAFYEIRKRFKSIQACKRRKYSCINNDFKNSIYYTILPKCINFIIICIEGAEEKNILSEITLIK